MAINAAVIGALMVAGPELVPYHPTPPTPTTIYDVPIEPPPPPDDPKPLDRTTPSPNPAPAPRPDISTSVLPTTDTGFVLPPGPPVTIDPGPITGTGSGVTIDPPRPPVLVLPGIDQRYARDLQPPYPPGERRAGNEGRVVVRVLIGVDGRVKQAERVSATSDAFWRATLDRALAKWRFTPGTRDGIPVEAWRVMTLTFVLEE